MKVRPNYFINMDYLKTGGGGIGVRVNTLNPIGTATVNLWKLYKNETCAIWIAQVSYFVHFTWLDITCLQ